MNRHINMAHHLSGLLENTVFTLDDMSRLVSELGARKDAEDLMKLADSLDEVIENIRYQGRL